MTAETCWMFCPRNMENKFLHYYLLHPRRPRMVVLLLQHQEKPVSYNLLRQRCVQYRQYRHGKFLRKSVPSRSLYQTYEFPGLMHVFLLAAR